MSGWVRSWVLVVACAPLACGSTDNNGAGGAAGIAGASGAAAAGGSAGSAGGAGSPGIAPVGVDPVVSAAYTWAECGRIEPSTKPVAALYTPDESVIEIEENGRIRLFPSGSPVGATLIAGRADSHASGAALSPDGRWLLAASAPSGVGVYATQDGAPFGAATTSVVRVSSFVTSGPATECAWPVGFSSDSQQLILRGPESVCIAEIEGGAVLTTIVVAPPQDAYAVALRDGATAPLREVRSDTLVRYAADGSLVDEQALLTDFPAGKVRSAVFTPDAQQLLLGFELDSPAADKPGLLVAFDAETRAELWRKPFSPTYDDFTIATDSSVVQIHRGGTFRISDGEQVGTDPKGLFTVVTALGPSGRRELRLGETLMEWDMQSGKQLQLYGSHTEQIRDLDISRDGRFLASHGDRAIVWQLNSDFARSLPLFNGAAPDDSWNVALAADGSILAVSGDNVSFFTQDGSHVYGGLPPPSAFDCLSADYSFSPLGSWAAGTHYGNDVVLYETAGFEPQSTLPTANCRGGVAFSPDGSQLVTASLELFDTSDWSRVWTRPAIALPSSSEHAVQFSPDSSEIVVTRCESTGNSTHNCSSERHRTSDGELLGRLPGLVGQRARYSPEGHWLISGNHLVHVPTGRLVAQAFADGEALFAPNGDIIVGEQDGALVRYCRGSL